jgi:hypothetical protein
MLFSPNLRDKFELHGERRAQPCPTISLNARLPMAPSLPPKKARHAPPGSSIKKITSFVRCLEGLPQESARSDLPRCPRSASMTGLAEIKHA